MTEKPVMIQCDSSTRGLGVCLLQDSQPEAYSTRSFTKTESNYANIERELLAIVFVAKQFHQFFGKEFLVISDHKAIETILKKPLHQASPRIQLMMLRLLRYKLKVQYRPGSQLYSADTPSTASVREKVSLTEQEFSEDIVQVHCTTATMPATTEKLRQIKNATKEDKVLEDILCFLRDNSWSSSRRSLSMAQRHYYVTRHDMHEENGIIFFKNRIVIPESMR